MAENKRVGVKLLRKNMLLEEDKLSIYWRFEHGGEAYGDYVLFNCGGDGRMEVPVDVFREGVGRLLQEMQEAENMLACGTGGQAMDNRCVCCGEIIPEGRWTCPKCDEEAKR